MADQRDKRLYRGAKDAPRQINHKNSDPTDNLEFRTPVKTEGRPYDPDPLHPLNTPDGKDHRPGAEPEPVEEELARAARILAGGSDPDRTTTEGVWPDDPKASLFTGGKPFQPEHYHVDPAKPGADQTVYSFVKPGHRPYLLESALVEQELRRQRDAAMGEMDAIDVDMLALETRTNDEISAIRARLDTELAARRQRKDDLQKIVDMTSRALDPTVNLPPTNAEVQHHLGQGHAIVEGGAETAYRTEKDPE